jgi:hypothetical protein
MILAGTFFLVGAVLLAAAYHVAMLILGRVIMGLGEDCSGEREAAEVCHGKGGLGKGRRPGKAGGGGRLPAWGVWEGGSSGLLLVGAWGTGSGRLHLGGRAGRVSEDCRGGVSRQAWQGVSSWC